MEYLVFMVGALAVVSIITVIFVRGSDYGDYYFPYKIQSDSQTDEDD